MRPVCPACRAEVALDAHACSRCGLAIRPTCGSCGEPLRTGLVYCRACHEPIDAAPTSHRLPPARSGGRRRSVAGVVFTGMLAGSIVSVGLLVVDTEARRWRWPQAADVRLVAQEAPRQDVTFRAPHHWELDEVSENVYQLADPRRGRDRTMLVQTGKTPFASIPKRLAQLNGGRYLDYRPLGTSRTKVDERNAIQHSFVGDELEHLQVWIEMDDGVLRVEFTFRPAEADDAVELSRRIVATLEIA